MRRPIDLEFRWRLSLDETVSGRVTMESALESRVTVASTLELSIVQIVLETYRSYESGTKRKSILWLGSRSRAVTSA